MSKELDDIMKKLEANKSKKKKAKAPVVEEKPAEEEEDEDEEDTKGSVAPVEKTEEKQAVQNEEVQREESPKVPSKEEIQKKQTEIEMLQNNGLYRGELLFQLQQINQNLLVLNQLVSASLEKWTEG